MKIGRNSKLVFIGDSITDADRSRPIGEGHAGALGRGYVAQVDALLTAASPESRLRIVNQGISGNTVRDLKDRWSSDVQDLEPDWLAVMIGINDVWRQFDAPTLTETHVHPDEYRSVLSGLVTQTRPGLSGLVLMSPFVIESCADEPMRKRMDEYGAIVREIAKQNDAIFVDVQAGFDAVLRHMHSTALAWDRIHPGAPGHAIISRAFLKQVGFEW